MRILVSGSRGFIGSALVDYMQKKGYEIRRLVRPDSFKEEGDFVWDPKTGYVDLEAFDECDAVVHLAAENVGGRWTDEKMKEIRRSRIEGASAICDAIKKLEVKPGIYISASGVGYYGSCGDKVITENAPCGYDFLARVSKEREKVWESLSKYGVRVVNTRFGMVIGKGGIIKKMIKPFQSGLGVKFGDGKQYWSWISRHDTVRAIAHIIETDSISGGVNVVSPNPVTNAEFSKIFAKSLNRPQFLTIPAWGARKIFGKMADNLLLASVRAEPEKLLKSGFNFDHINLENALASEMH